jgi:hypothetical protein
LRGCAQRVILQNYLYCEIINQQSYLVHLDKEDEEQAMLFVKFLVPTAGSMKMSVFWNIAPCSLVETDRRFRGAYCFHHHGHDNGRRNLL